MGPSSLCGRNILKVWKPAEHIYQFLQQLPCCSENHWEGKWLSYHQAFMRPELERKCCVQSKELRLIGLGFQTHASSLLCMLRTGTRHLILCHEWQAQCLTKQGPETGRWTELILMQIARLPLAADTLWVTYREMFVRYSGACELRSHFAPTNLCDLDKGGCLIKKRN